MATIANRVEDVLIPNTPNGNSHSVIHDTHKKSNQGPGLLAFGRRLCQCCLLVYPVPSTNQLSRPISRRPNGEILTGWENKEIVGTTIVS